MEEVDDADADASTGYEYHPSKTQLISVTYKMHFVRG
jgi:hypothetical protein